MAPSSATAGTRGAEDVIALKVTTGHVASVKMAKKFHQTLPTPP